jgi:hypothetical protein
MKKWKQRKTWPVKLCYERYARSDTLPKFLIVLAEELHQRLFLSYRTLVSVQARWGVLSIVLTAYPITKELPQHSCVGTKANLVAHEQLRP